MLSLCFYKCSRFRSLQEQPRTEWHRHLRGFKKGAAEGTSTPLREKAPRIGDPGGCGPRLFLFQILFRSLGRCDADFAEAHAVQVPNGFECAGGHKMLNTAGIEYVRNIGEMTS